MRMNGLEVSLEGDMQASALSSRTIQQFARVIDRCNFPQVKSILTESGADRPLVARYLRNPSASLVAKPTRSSPMILSCYGWRKKVRVLLMEWIADRDT